MNRRSTGSIEDNCISNAQPDKTCADVAMNSLEGERRRDTTRRADVRVENLVDNPEVTALQRAVVKGDTQVVKHLLDRGVDIECRTNYNHTPLHLAIFKDNADVVELLAARGADVNARGRYRRTPLHIAAGVGSVQIWLILVTKGCDPLLKDEYGLRPLDLAVWYGREQICKFLGSHITQDDVRLLHAAARRGHFQVIKLLLLLGVDVDAANENGDTALHFAAHNGHQGATTFLVKCGANMNIANKSGITPISLAKSRFPADFIKAVDKIIKSSQRRLHSF